MNEIYQTIKQIYFDLNGIGINILSIGATIPAVHGIKTYLNKYTFYNDKTKSIINIAIGLIIGILFAIILNLDNLQITAIIKTSIMSFMPAMFSREIIDAVIKIFSKEK